MRPISMWSMAICCLAPVALAQTATLSAAKSHDSITIESTGGSLTYTALIDPKSGGDITQFRLPADGPIVARELNDIFYHGAHADEYTLRGWTGKSKFVISCSLDLVSQKPDEIIVRVDLLATGTFKSLASDEAAKAAFRKTHASYKVNTVAVKRTYTFKPDRILLDDQVEWLYPDMALTSIYLTAAFMPGSIQGPVRLAKGTLTASFLNTWSGGKKIPEAITYPFTADNFLKNGYKISLRTTDTSFDLAKSDFYFYERPWQQDWHQLSGFMYRPADKLVHMSHELTFAKATPSEMPPVVTIHSPAPTARWMDEKGEVAPYKIGDTVKLSASAVNSDGTPVPPQDITWEIHIDPWWNTPPATVHGADLAYTLPQVANEADKTTSKDRSLLAVITVTAKGKNGTEAVEPFAMLVGKAGD